MYTKKYLKLLSTLSNEEQMKYLTEINQNQENELKTEFRNILNYWFQIYGEDGKMTFQQFFYFWSRNTDKQADREPENISKNFFARHAKEGSQEWNLQSFVAYFTEKSIQRPNLVLRMLLFHDFDYSLKKLGNDLSLQNDYGSQKILEEKDLKLFTKRVDCHKICLISKIEDASFYNIFLSKMNSISYLYEGYYGFFVMEEYLKLLNFHKNHLQKVDVRPLKVASFIRVSSQEIDELSKILLSIKNISILELTLNIKFDKQRSQMNEESWATYQIKAQKSIQNLNKALQIILSYQIQLIHFKYRLKIQEDVYSKEQQRQIMEDLTLVPLKQKIIFFFKASQKAQSNINFRKEIYWDCFNILFGIQQTQQEI
ncbi:hypothetical protein ABPG72_000355 [Tetrahymena utriculariae]